MFQGLRRQDGHDGRWQRFISNCIVFSTAALFLSDPLLGPFLARPDPVKVRMQLYISATAYGLPLIAAFLLALRMRARTPLLLMDRLVIAMCAIWCVAVGRGIVAANEPRFILSDAFNFWIPIGVYGAMRVLDDVEPILTGLRRILIISLPLQLVYTAWLVGSGRVQSAGLPFFVLYPTWFLHEGSIAGVTAGLVLFLAGQKRAFIVAAVLGLVVFALLARRRRFLQIAAIGAVVMVIGIVATPSLRSRFAILSYETGGFRHLQVRQDELNGIGRSMRDRDWPLSLVIGQGMGATYRLTVGESSGSLQPFILPRHHDTHVSPAGWFLRTGLVGMLIYGAFFLCGAFLAVRVALSSADSRDAALTASYLMMLVLSLTTFTVPMMPIVTVAMMLVVARRGGRR